MKLDIFGMFFTYMRTSRLFSRWIPFLFVLPLASIAFANPVGINISGRIVDEASNTALSGSVSFRVKVLTKNNCILYSEEFNSYTIPSSGTFTFTLGKGSSPVNAYHPGDPIAAQSALGMNNVFSNAHTVSVNTLGEGRASGSPTSGDNVACGGAGVAYTPADDDVRKVRIEFDDGDGQGYKAILPYHQIRTVPYAMLAEEANNALKLGGNPAADYAKLTDLPDLSTAVPAAETDPSVKAFAKANISGLTAGSCAVGQVLSYNGTALVCVADAGGSSTPIATDTVVGSVMVPAASYISLAGTGEIDVKDLPISKITNLQTALNGTLKVADMPASSCAAGEALIWSSPSNVFTCSAITIDSAHVSDFDAAVDARIAAGNTGSPKLPLAGGTMTGDITMGGHDVLATGHITMSNQKTITVGKYDQTQENTLAGTLNGANEGATWYNSAMKALRFWDGTARQTVVSTTAACADGQLLKWNDTTKVWYCAADAGAGGADASSINGVAVNPVPAPSADGQVLRYDNGTSKWIASLIQAADLPTGIARSKVAVGTANHVLINDGTGTLSSEAQLAVSRGGTGQSTYTDGQLLIGKTDGTLAKATLTAGTGITVTNGDGTITIDATATAPSDASYAAKGVVQLLTDAPTSGLNVASGVISVNSGTAANQLVKLDGTAKLPAVDGSALTNLTAVIDKITNAAGKYFGYKPNNVACADGEVLKWDNSSSHWICGADAGAGGADASSIRGKTIAVSVGTPAAGSFLTYDDATTSWVASVFTDCTAAGSAIHYNATLNTWSCDALTVGSSNITDGSIVNADIDAAAAIARTKLASGTAYRIVANDATGVMGDAAAITASRALISDANGIPTHSTVTATELGYVSGVTSAIQTQIDGLATGSAGKVAKAGDTMTGNLVMNAQKEVRFADSDSSNFIGFKAPATVASDVTFTLPAADGTAGYVLKTDGAGTLSWVAQTAAPGDASYAAKGVVQFNTDADTSGVTVAAGVATVNTGTAANQIVKLDGTAKLPAVDGSALTNVTVSADKVTSGAGKYLTYAPNNVACANGEVLKKTANGWECGTDAGSSGADAISIRGKSVAVSAGTPAAGSFLTYDNATTSWVASVFTDCTAAGSAIHYNATLNTWSCDALTVGSSNITDGSIVDADVSATAAIARTKLANGTANRVLVNDGSGVMVDAAAITASRALISDANGIPTHSTVTATELGYVSGVTSAIQTQIDGLATGSAGKVAKTGDTMTGNLVMNAQKEVRFADSDSSNFIGLRSPATVASDVTFTLPAADGTAGYVLQTDGAGALSWAAQTAAPVNASYAAKGIVQFDTDAATSGVTVAAGVATINTGTTANQIVKLDSNAKLPAVDGSQLTNIITSLVPASSTILMASCPGGWTDNGAATSALCSGAACRMCQSPASASSIPASTVIKMESCPAGWTGVGYDSGPNSAGFDAINFVNCQSPGSASKLPLNARMIMPSCPAQWNDLGPTGPTGPLVATCSGTACRVCEVPGAQMPSHIVASTAGAVVFTGGAGGGTNLNGGAVNITGGAGGASNGNGGSVVINGGIADGTGNSGNVFLAPSIGKVSIGMSTTPSYTVDVNGDVNITGSFRVNGTAIGAGSGTVTSVSSANADIGVSMASPTPVLTLNSGTGANQIVKLDGSSKLPAVDGSALTNLNANNLASGTLSTSLLPVIPVTKGGTGASSLAANNLIGTNGTGTVQQAVTCALNQVLSFDASGNYGCYALSSIYSGFVNGGNTFGAASNIGNNDSFDLNIKTNNLARVTVQAGGNVGIGVTNPTAILDVDGGTSATGKNISLKAGSSSSVNGTGGTVSITGGVTNAGTSTSGGVAIAGGDANANSSIAGSVTISGGAASAASSIGGSIYLMPGTGTSASGRVGIGTTTPSALLEVNGDIAAASVTASTLSGSNIYSAYLGLNGSNTNGLTMGIQNTSVTGYSGAYFTDAGGAMQGAVGFSNASAALVPDTVFLASMGTKPLVLGTNGGVERLRITTAGAVGIGTSNPSYGLHVNGSVAGTSAYNNLSDGRLKRNVANVPDALNKVSEIRGVSFDWRKNEHPELKLGDRKELGVIAQEVERVFPEAVSVDKNTGIRSVAYSMLIAPLIEATKEVRNWLLSHDREIASLKEKNAQLEKKNEQLETYLCGKDPHAPFCIKN